MHRTEAFKILANSNLVILWLTKLNVPLQFSALNQIDYLSTPQNNNTDHLKWCYER